MTETLTTEAAVEKARKKAESLPALHSVLVINNGPSDLEENVGVNKMLDHARTRKS